MNNWHTADMNEKDGFVDKGKRYMGDLMKDLDGWRFFPSHNFYNISSQDFLELAEILKTLDEKGSQKPSHQGSSPQLKNLKKHEV